MHRGEAKPRLYGRLDEGELRIIVDAERLGFWAIDRGAASSGRAGDFLGVGGVGKVELILEVNGMSGKSWPDSSADDETIIISETETT